MCDRFPCITRSIISAPTNFIQSRLQIAIINLTVKILTNSNILFGNLLYSTIFLMFKCIPAFIKIGCWGFSSIYCFPLSQIKVGIFVLLLLSDVLGVEVFLLSGESWTDLERLGEKWWKSLIISDNQVETFLIITINDTSLGYLPLIINISDTCKNQSKTTSSETVLSLLVLTPTPVFVFSLHFIIFGMRDWKKIDRKPNKKSMLL